MNKERDFHKKSSGTLINANTKDYRRAKNRNKVMKTAVAALGEDGELAVVTKKVDDMTNAPSRAEERVRLLEAELETTKAINKDIQEKLDKTLTESEVIKDQLYEANKLNQDINDKLDGAYELKNEFLQLKQLVESKGIE